MSADNWTTCPECLKRHKKEINKLQYSLEGKYGFVTRERFESLLRELKVLKRKDSNFPKTLREDYEIYIVPETFKLYVGYFCHCDKCNFEFNYNKENIHVN